MDAVSNRHGRTSVRNRITETKRPEIWRRLYLEASVFCFGMAKCKNVNNFVWNGHEVELLLRIKKQYKVSKSVENVDWESVHQKHKEIFERFKAEMEKLFSKRPDYPRLHGTRNRIALKMLHFRQRFQKKRFHWLLFYRSRINGMRNRIEKDAFTNETAFV